MLLGGGLGGGDLIRQSKFEIQSKLAAQLLHAFQSLQPVKA